MIYFVKVFFVSVYLSLGIFFGLAIRYLPNISIFDQWGKLVLFFAALLCPFGIKAFGWFNEASRFSVILTCFVSVVGITLWFFISAIAVALIGIGNG